MTDELEDEEPSMRKCRSCNWEFDGTGTKCPDCRINDGDVLDITPFQAHSLIKACEAIGENESNGRYTQAEIEACRDLILHLRIIAGQTADPS